MMHAYEIHQPNCYVIVRTHGHVARLSPVAFRNLLADRKGLWRAREKSALTSVVEVLFDADETDHRVEIDCINRPVLLVGAAFLFRYWATLPDNRQDRWFDDIASDLIDRPDTARDAADGMTQLARSHGVVLAHS